MVMERVLNATMVPLFTIKLKAVYARSRCCSPHCGVMEDAPSP